MVIGESKIANMVLRMIGPESRNQIDEYINNVSTRDFLIIKSMEQIQNIFKSSLDNFLTSLTEEELLNLRSYTGYNFRNINAILRGNWSYEVNGALNEEKIKELKKLSNSISQIVNKFNLPEVDFITFRGTTLDSFSSYGISELSQLKNLKGKFLYEPGFTSTSIIEDTCYFNKNLEDGKNYNIEIRYLISSECNDGALLIDWNISYSSNQNEFLLNSASLSKVIDVKIDENNNSAVLTVILIPKKIYELNLDKTRNSF